MKEMAVIVEAGLGVMGTEKEEVGGDGEKDGEVDGENGQEEAEAGAAGSEVQVKGLKDGGVVSQIEVEQVAKNRGLKAFSFR